MLKDHDVPCGALDAVFVPSVDDLMVRNAEYASTFAYARLSNRPQLRLAIVTCMDTRLDVLELFGLEPGEAHVIRNAGGVISDDVIRSLMLSQRSLGTVEVILLHHTDCGMSHADEALLRSELEAEIGVKPQWAIESFADPYADVRQSIRRVRMSPFVRHDEHVRGFVYEVETGLIHEVAVSD